MITMIIIINNKQHPVSKQLMHTNIYILIFISLYISEICCNIFKLNKRSTTQQDEVGSFPLIQLTNKTFPEIILKVYSFVCFIK